MAFSRSCVIERVMSGISNDVLPGPSNYTSVEHFEKENIREVECKIARIDNQIWGKIIVMENSCRTAKAYVRNQSVCLDSGEYEFDGVKLGLRRFSSARSIINSSLNQLGKGLIIWIDNTGNLWLQRNCPASIHVTYDGQTHCVGTEPVKIFELRSFKEKLLTHMGESPTSAVQFYKKSLVYVQISCGGPILHTPLWICIVHLIAFEMTSLLANAEAVNNRSNFNGIPSQFPESPATKLFRLEDLSTHTGQTLYDNIPNMKEIAELGVRRLGTKNSVVFSEHHMTDSSVSRSASSSSKDSEPGIKKIFHKNEPWQNNSRNDRGGVKKKLERFTERDRVGCISQQELIRSMPVHEGRMIDLRSLANLKRPVYFGNPVRSSHRTRSLPSLLNENFH